MQKCTSIQSKKAARHRGAVMKLSVKDALIEKMNLRVRKSGNQKENARSAKFTKRISNLHENAQEFNGPYQGFYRPSFARKRHGKNGGEHVYKSFFTYSSLPVLHVSANLPYTITPKCVNTPAKTPILLRIKNRYTDREKPQKPLDAPIDFC
jgi:hypothetical protein